MDSKLIVHILTPALIGIVLFIVASLILKSNKTVSSNYLNQTSIIVYLPRAYFWIGLVDSAVFLIFIILAIHINSETSPVWVFVLFAVFLLLGIFIMLETIMWKVEAPPKEDYFIYNSVFCRNKKIFYKDCSIYKCTQNTLIVYTGRKMIFIDMFSTNYDAIYNMLVSKKVKFAAKSNRKRK